MPAPARCPTCDQRIFNRRLALCEFCGALLPLSELLSPEELEADEDRVDAEARRARFERRLDRDERAEVRRRRRRGFGWGFPLGPFG